MERRERDWLTVGGCKSVRRVTVRLTASDVSQVHSSDLHVNLTRDAYTASISISRLASRRFPLLATPNEQPEFCSPVLDLWHLLRSVSDRH